MNRFNLLRPHAEEHRRVRLEAWATSWSRTLRDCAFRAPPGEDKGKAMTQFLKDVPFKGSRRVYLAIKLIVLLLAVLLALHFFFGVV